MEQLGSYLTQFATKEVFTVVAALATAWIGWKTAGKAYGGLKTVAKNASFGGLAAMGLLFAGFGGVGLGVGEWMSRDGNPEPVAEQQFGMTNAELQELMKESNGSRGDEEAITAILEYVKERDQAEIDKEESERLVVMRGDQEVAFLPTSFKSEESFEITKAPEEEIRNAESIMSTPMAWASLMLGIASIIASGYVYDNRRSHLA